MKHVTRILALACVCALSSGCAYVRYTDPDGSEVVSARLLWKSEMVRAKAGQIEVEGYAGQGQEGALEAVARGAAAGATQP